MKKSILLSFLLFATHISAQDGCWKQVHNTSTSVGIKNDGSLWIWGYSLGCNLNNHPTQVDASTNWSSVTSGGNGNVYAIKTDGTLWSWGTGDLGALGNGSSESSCLFVQIGTDNDWVQVKGGLLFGVALKSNGTLWSWGYNSYGQLGNGTNTHSLVPVQVGQATDWVQISAGTHHTVALKTDGSAWTWGSNAQGQLGIGFYSAYSNVPVAVVNGTDFSKISSAEHCNHAIKNDGTLWAWGENDFTYGNGTANTSLSAVQVGSASDWLEICTGLWTSFAIKNNHSLWAWGTHSIGALGNGSIEGLEIVPLQIGEDQWKMAGCPGSSSMGIKEDGSLWSWGRNDYGQLGLGSAHVGTEHTLPTAVVCPTLNNREFADLTILKLFPNPVQDQLTVECADRVDRIECYDLTGRLQLSANVNAYSGSVTVGMLQSGLYVVKIFAGEQTQTFKLLKE